ncbi:MAG: preprotein translocase subunit SecE [Burkholderiales bacterium]|jgi:preprotein translocase subunit SecE|nr:preprotein translocase subunit SecE [Burkholderiales bacterium]
MLDKIKITVAILCVVGGLWAYYHFADVALGLRALMVLCGLVLGGLVTWSSNPGKTFIGFAQDAWREGARVAWPSRQETRRMTLVVFAFVVVMSLFLFLVDNVVAWLIKLFIG